MEPVFHLPFAEFEAISQFGQVLKKQQGFGIFIPISRQQEGIDFLVLNNRSQRTLRVQVKSSHWYEWDTPPYYRFWYNNFVGRYRPCIADVYAFTALYPVYEPGHHVREQLRFWRTSILVFTDQEMAEFLPRIKNKSGKADRFFQFGFDLESAETDIKVTRPDLPDMKLAPHLLKNRVDVLKKLLK
jgi:hypothetical protein